jgi:hypothetical protein
MISEIYFKENEIMKSYEALDYGPIENLINKCRSCNRNLASNDPASQYQRQKIIQNTVRVPASLYTDNLGALTVYELPDARTRVNWKQMSDRRKPSLQTAYVPTWGSSTKHTITRNRPGAMSPGGLGVDMKHNSYHRYLARIKGKAPLRRGVIPPDFGAPFIPFSRVLPIYGGKTVKTNIVNKCNCPIISKEERIVADDLIYRNSRLEDEIYSIAYKFSIGDFVYAAKEVDRFGPYYKALIIDIVNGLYEIEFEDDKTINFKTIGELLIYFDCGICKPFFNETVDHLVISYLTDNKISPACEALAYIANNQLSSDLLNYVQTVVRKALYPNLIT